MKEYHKVLYAVYTSFLRIVPAILIYVPLEINGIHMRSSCQKLNVPHWKTNVGQKALSYVGPSFWNNSNKTLKTSTSLNAFKHNIKQHYFILKNGRKKSPNNSFCNFDVLKYFHLNFTIYMPYFEIFSFLSFYKT